MIEDNPYISKYAHDQCRPREAEALPILRRIAYLVSPLMKRRKWKIRILAEFYPDDAGLLGRNVGPGETVFLRLRFCNNDAIFLPMEIILSTMLHELAHMVYGPHNNDFYNLCSQLKDEYVQLIHMGYASEIYSSTRHNTGNGHIIEHEAQNYPTLPAQSGQRFGIGQDQDIRKVIADTATKRFKKNEDRYDPASKKNPAGSRRSLAGRLAVLTASKEGP